jgi:hypothetical protein
MSDYPCQQYVKRMQDWLAMFVLPSTFLCSKLLRVLFVFTEADVVEA